MTEIVQFAVPPLQAVPHETLSEDVDLVDRPRDLRYERDDDPLGEFFALRVVEQPHERFGPAVLGQPRILEERAGGGPVLRDPDERLRVGAPC